MFVFILPDDRRREKDAERSYRNADDINDEEDPVKHHGYKLELCLNLKKSTN